MTIKSLSLACMIIGTISMGAHISTALAQSDEVYQQFGGKAGISAIITEAIATWQKDPRIARYFLHANIPHLRYELIQQVCNLTNGPCVYTGKDMKTAHEHMQLTQASFNALDEDLNAAMDDHNVPLSAQNYLTGKLAPMEQPIVTKNGF